MKTSNTDFKRINFNKNIHLDLCCSHDELTPILQMIYFDKGNAIASDGHCMIIAPLEEISTFGEDERNILQGKMISYEQYKKIIKYQSVDITDAGFVCNDDISETTFKFIDSEMKYPDYEKVLPKRDEKKEVSLICVNVCYIEKISKAVGIDRMKLTFNGENKAVVVNFSGSDVLCIVMPILFED